MKADRFAGTTHWEGCWEEHVAGRDDKHRACHHEQAIALLREMTEQMEELLGDTLMVRKAKEFLEGGDEG